MYSGWVLGILLAYVPPGLAKDKVFAPDLSRVHDGKKWHVINGEVRSLVEDGKRVVRLEPKGQATTPSDIGLASSRAWSLPRAPSRWI
jgi:hypothetical protein